ncbi:hypothetical protein RJ640_017022 [Escallonia rubra]|uniref:FAR1 domain-containing protein n=1 Tax=Escallonia rubra TaxID=112253 RepID=A0AA88U7F2_9ASTE|nr:hypothetical protein RJ640_017022 [Escallonia rubra]
MKSLMPNFEDVKILLTMMSIAPMLHVRPSALQFIILPDFSSLARKDFSHSFFVLICGHNICIATGKELASTKDLKRQGGRLTMDFEIDGDVNGVMLGNSLEMEGRLNDGIEMGESSDDGAFQQELDVKEDQDLSERSLVPIEETHAVNTSATGDEPYVNQEFDSESAAHAFYNAYATRVGFIIRVSKLSRSRRDGTAIGRALVCNKEGFRMPDKREKIVRQRAETRVGCRAMILVRKVSSGKWIVTKFVKEHTHPLAPGKGRRDLIYDQYPVSLASSWIRFLVCMHSCARFT